MHDDAPPVPPTNPMNWMSGRRLERRAASADRTMLAEEIGKWNGQRHVTSSDDRGPESARRKNDYPCVPQGHARIRNSIISMQITDQRVGRAVIAVGWLVIALLTLVPTGDNAAAAGGSPWCIACGPGWGADALANILLFVPLGLGFSLAGVRLRHALLAVALTTLTVEVLQFSLVAGRDASLADLLANFTGGTVGFLLGRARAHIVRPRPALAAALALLWSALWLAGTAATAWALAPSLPQSPWFAHWTTPADFPAASPVHEPRVLEARVGNAPIVFGRVEYWSALRPLALDGAGITVRAVVPNGADTTNGKIALVDDADSEKELFSFWRRGDGITFAMGTRASMLGLHGPAVSIPRLLRPGGPDTLRITGGITGGRLHIEAQRGDTAVSRSLALTPNRGWTFFFPQRFVTGPLLHPLTALWIICLVLPIGYWAARARRGARRTSRAVALAAALAPGAALAVVPWWFHLPPVHWFEWLAWAAGIAAGASLAFRVGSIVATSSAHTPITSRRSS
jgi:hypothetical protein